MKLKEAIKILKSYENKLVYEISEKDKEAVAVVLNHLTKQEKIIELMAEEFEEWAEFLDEEGYYTCLLSRNKEEVKQYFEKKAEEIDNK